MLESAQRQAVEPSSRLSSETGLRNWNPDRVFWIFCAIHLVIWTLVPAYSRHSLPKDTMEAIAWGQLWELGYDKHPILAPWVSAFFTELFATPGWPVYLAAQLSVLLCFWAIWQLARAMLKPWQALVAVVILEGINYYNLSAYIFNPNVLMLPTWAMLTLTVYRALEKPSNLNWVHAGLWAGLALLAKYQSIVIFATLMLAILLTSRGRQCLKSTGFYLGVLTALMVLSPHLYWLITHNFVTLGYGISDFPLAIDGTYLTEKSGYQFLNHLNFLGQQIAALIPTLLLFLFFRRGKWRIDLGNFDHIFILVMTVGPLLITLLIAVVANGSLVTRWGFPYFSTLGIALLLFFNAAVDRRALVRFVTTVAGINLLIAVGFVWSNRFQTSSPSNNEYPFREVAEHVTRTWHDRFNSSLNYVAGHRWVISGISTYSQDKPIPYFELDMHQNPWIKEEDMRKKGAAIVFKYYNPGAAAQLESRLRKRYPALSEPETLAIPYYRFPEAPPAQFWIAFLAPEQ